MRLARSRPETEPAPERPAEPLPEWEYVPDGWAHEAQGWAVDSAARGYREKWADYLAAIEAPNPLGVHHETARVTPRTALDYTKTALEIEYPDVETTANAMTRGSCWRGI